MGANLLERQKAHDREVIFTTERITLQLCVDVLQITLHERFGFGYERLTDLTEAFTKNYDQYREATEGTVESDVWQERLDRALLDIVKDERKLMPFHARYPEIVRHSYDKPLKKRRK